MDDNQTIEELKRQLEEAQEKNRQLEEEMLYKDKITGLWNRKYAKKIIAGSEQENNNSNFTVAYAEVDGLGTVGAKLGEDASEKMLREIADSLRGSFGDEAVCCKLAESKMCVFLTVSEEDLKIKITEWKNSVKEFEDNNPDIAISYGLAKKETYPEKDTNALLKEAEYEMQMFKVSRQAADNSPASPVRKKKSADEITILMIDDSLVNLRTVQLMLKDTYKTLLSTSGLEGFEIAKKKSPDLILLDYNMPVVDGERILTLLKQCNITKDIPVIFVSGVSDREKILKVASLKPAGYLLKPVEKNNLLNVINTVLQTA